MSYPAKLAVALAFAALALLSWHLRAIIVLAFGSVLAATVLRAICDRLQRWLHVSSSVAVPLAVAMLVVVAAGFTWWLGRDLVAQFSELTDRLPAGASDVRAWLLTLPLGPQLVALWEHIRGAAVPWKHVAGAAEITAGAVAKLAVMVFAGIFLAAQPALYRRGAIRLFPPDKRATLEGALSACNTALRGWLKGQAVSMLCVGAATGLGLALLGVPLPLAVGVLAGVLDFVPFFGPILSGTLAVLLAFTESPMTALYVLVLVMAVQHLEAYLLVPLLQKWAVQLPPALSLFAVIIAAALFGLLGAIFATPLMVVTLVLVRRLFVERVLERA